MLLGGVCNPRQHVDIEIALLALLNKTNVNKFFHFGKQAPKLQTFAAAPRVECTQTSCAETEVQVLQKKTIILLHTCV